MVGRQPPGGILATEVKMPSKAAAIPAGDASSRENDFDYSQTSDNAHWQTRLGELELTPRADEDHDSRSHVPNGDRAGGKEALEPELLTSAAPATYEA